MPVRIQRYIALLSVVLFIGKLWAWYLTHSVAILTDALESTVNVITGFMGLYSLSLAAKPRDSNHPYGHGKAQFVSSAVEGALISIAGLFIIYEAIDQLLEAKPLHKLNLGIFIIVGAGLLNTVSGYYALNAGKKHRSLVIESAGKHLLSDGYSTLAIIVGLGLVILTKAQWLDSVVALIFAGIIIVTGYKVLRKSLAGIMDEADEVILKEVITLLQENRKPEWIDLHNLRVIQYGDVLHVDTHMTIPWYYQVLDADKAIHEVENLVKTRFESRVELFIHIDACMPYSCKLCSVQNCPVRKEAFKVREIWIMDNLWENSKHGKTTG